MPKMLDLAVADEVDNLMLDCGNLYPALPKATNRALPRSSLLQKPYLREEQFGMHIDLARAAAAAKLTARPAARVAYTRKRLDGCRQRSPWHQEIEVA